MLDLAPKQRPVLIGGLLGLVCSDRHDDDTSVRPFFEESVKLVEDTVRLGYFAALYRFMYMLVTSDEYALLAGALGLFTILAVAMVLTRKVDWYQAA